MGNWDRGWNVRSVLTSNTGEVGLVIVVAGMMSKLSGERYGANVLCNGVYPLVES